MMTIKTYLEFWGEDLTNIRISKEIEKVLPPVAIMFLDQYGLPTSERMFRERKTYLESTTPIPEIFLSEKNIEKNIKSVRPYFEFISFVDEPFEFQGLKFVRIGNEGEHDIAIEVNSGSVNYIIRSLPVSCPTEFAPLVQNLLINSGMDKLGMSLTAEFLARRERIKARKKYVEAINSDNAKLRDESEGEINQIIDNLENEFRALDNEALIVPESYWRDYLINIRDQ